LIQTGTVESCRSAGLFMRAPMVGLEFYAGG
jgi:hypothetical protein